MIRIHGSLSLSLSLSLSDIICALLEDLHWHIILTNENSEYVHRLQRNAL